MKQRKQADIELFNKAKIFLLNNTPEDVTKQVIESYLSLPEPQDMKLSVNDLYYRLLSSAQNANMKSKVVGGSIGGVKNLKYVLFDFDPALVLEKYSDNLNLLLDDIIKRLNPTGKIRRTDRSLWPQYCRTILSAAVFMEQFENVGSFLEWVHNFYKDKKLMAALPMVIEAEIYGVAFPLACDFLKELGYLGYGRPDGHIKDIFFAASVVEGRVSNYSVLKALVRIAENVGVTTYEIDKIFWLIGSGFFYNHQHIGKRGHVGRMKLQFIHELAETFQKNSK